jgi:hypothetical protein
MTSAACTEASGGQRREALGRGQQIHRWTILQEAAPALSSNGRWRLRWLCRCVCGSEKVVLDQSLRLALKSPVGGSRSCGCLMIECSFKHGHNRGQHPTAEYGAWLSAKKRCNNPKNSSFGRYGGRGIRMCERWSADFGAFLADMGRKPDPSLSLDRIDPDGDYCPGNCRWASIEVQSRNRAGIRWYEFEGQPALLGDIARFFGVSRDEARGLVRKRALPVRPLAKAPRVPDRLVPLILDLNLVQPMGDLTLYEHGLVILD